MRLFIILILICFIICGVDYYYKNKTEINKKVAEKQLEITNLVITKNAIIVSDSEKAYIIPKTSISYIDMRNDDIIELNVNVLQGTIFKYDKEKFQEMYIKSEE